MKKQHMITLLLIIGMSLPGFAAELVNGAGTLSQGTKAFSLDLGVDLPQPVGTSFRFDYGLTDRIQVGVSGSYFFISGGGGLSLAANLFESADGTHLLGARITPTYNYANVAIMDAHIIAFDPTLVYEARLGSEQNIGLYLRAGSLHAYGKFGSDALEGLFGAGTANTSLWAHGYRFGGGAQFAFGERFSMTVDGGLLSRSDFSYNKPLGKLGFTWAF